MLWNDDDDAACPDRIAMQLRISCMRGIIVAAVNLIELFVITFNLKVIRFQLEWNETVRYVLILSIVNWMSSWRCGRFCVAN